MNELAWRGLLMGLGVAAWFWTQHLLSRRRIGSGIADAFHQWTAPLHAWLSVRPRAINLTLVISSALIDLIGIGLIAFALFGPSFRPFVALFILFALRQASQVLCALPPPPGSIWHHPGVPALLVTYDTDHDYFFSGHTAIAVLGALELAHSMPSPLGWVGAGIALLEAATVLVLRAHYTMDVFTAVLAAYASHILAERWSPAVDRWLTALG